ncbi:MAG: hypothetical protein WBB18_17140, partial [Nodosilinea sp.]
GLSPGCLGVANQNGFRGKNVSIKKAGDESFSHHPAADNPKYFPGHTLTSDLLNYAVSDDHTPR